MARDLAIAVLLIALVMASRPAAPQPQEGPGEDLPHALAMLGGADAAQPSERTHAPMDREYRHWDTGTAPHPRPALPAAPDEGAPPMVAGLVAVADALGLRELAGLGLYLLSDMAEDREDWVAVDLLLRAIPYVDPRMADAYIILSFIRRVDDPAGAEEILLRGVHYNPDVWELWYDLAWLQIGPHHRGDPDLWKARRYLEGALAAPHPLFLTRTYGAVLQAQGRKAEAEKLYRELLARPDLPDVDRVATQQALKDCEQDVDRLGLFRQRLHRR